MSETDTHWFIKGREFVHCNCAYGCPCQFNALPTAGHCQAVAGVMIDNGVHGQTDISGLAIAMVVAWPGPIHEGKGQVVPIVDAQADEAQRDALLRIMSGLDTVPGATFFQVFATTYEKVENPVFAPIELAVDIDGRRASLRVEGWIDARGEPIANPVTGEEHRARINLPHGFEYETCEVGRGWATTQGPVDVTGRRARLLVPGVIDARGEPIVNPVTGEEQRARINLPDGFEYDVCEVGRGWASTQGPVDVQLRDSHAQFAYLNMTESGVVHPL